MTDARGNTPPEPTLVRWLHNDIRFKDDLDTDALFAAIEPPQDVLDTRSLADIQRNEDTLESRLRAWGWGCDYGYLDRGGPLRHIGCYYDYTTVEDDERFFPLIAPFVEEGSLAVFELRDGYDPPEAWIFDGETARRGEATKTVIWQPS